MEKTNRVLEKISIIIPTCTGLNCLSKIIFNIIDLNYQNFEIIIADNSPFITTSFPSYLKNRLIKYIKSTPYSKTMAINNAVKTATGIFLLFLDSDVLVKDKNVLMKLVNEIKKNERTCFSIKFKNIDNKYEGLGGKLFIPSREFKNIFFKKNQGNKDLLDYPQGFAFFLKKEIWDKIGGYDELIPFGCEELDIGFKLKLEKVRCILFKKTDFIDLGVPQGKSLNTSNDYFSGPQKNSLMIYGKWYFIKKYYSKFDFILVISALFFFQMFLSLKKSIIHKNTNYIKQFFLTYFNIIFK